MAVSITNAHGFSASFSQYGVGQLVPNSTSSLTLIFIASTSSNNAQCTNVDLAGSTITFLNSYSVLSGVYRRLDVYYAFATAGPPTPAMLTFNTVPGQIDVEVAIVSFTGVIQQPIAYVGGVKGTVTKDTTPSLWQGLAMTVGAYLFSVFPALAITADFSGTTNQYGFKSNMGVFSISDGTTPRVIAVQFQ